MLNDFAVLYMLVMLSRGEYRFLGSWLLETCPYEEETTRVCSTMYCMCPRLELWAR